MESYWTTISTQRIDRRRALSVTGGAGLGAALLAACGSGGKKSSGSNNSSGLVTQPADSFKQAKRGGTLRDQTATDSPTLDIIGPIAGGTANNATRVYSALVRAKPGYLKPYEGDLVPDIAESWEWSQDGLQITLKLRQGVKFHNKPPVNGRPLDVEDVLFSWNRFATKAPLRDFVSNAANPQAPVLSLTAPDPRTVVMKLKEPLVYTLELFAPFSGGGNVAIVPKETDTTFDSRGDMIGTGPIIMSKY